MDVDRGNSLGQKHLIAISCSDDELSPALVKVVKFQIWLYSNPCEKPNTRPGTLPCGPLNVSFHPDCPSPRKLKVVLEPCSGFADSSIFNVSDRSCFLLGCFELLAMKHHKVTTRPCCALRRVKLVDLADVELLTRKFGLRCQISRSENQVRYCTVPLPFLIIQFIQ